MTTAWDQRWIIFVKKAAQANANSLYRQYVAEDSGDTFVIACGKNGTTPITWYLCNTAITGAMRTKWTTEFGDSVSGGLAAAYRIDDGSWTIDSALSDLDIGIIPVEE